MVKGGSVHMGQDKHTVLSAGHGHSSGVILQAEGISKAFDPDAPVLEGIDLTVRRGDVIAILGSSGGGKTTLLRCLNFLERADAGTLVFDNERYDLKTIGKKDIQAIRKRTAFVFQNYNLFLNKTALGNVMEGLVTARHMDKKEAEAKAKQALDNVGLSDRYHYYPNQLSGGQQQRVAIARAIVTDPEIIYFDEPTSALDPELTGEVLAVMRSLAESGRTMLVVTHEIGFAKNAANKIIFMDQGRIVEENSSQSFFTEPREQRSRDFIQAIANKDL